MLLIYIPEESKCESEVWVPVYDESGLKGRPRML
jgi:hypothetical protein